MDRTPQLPGYGSRAALALAQAMAASASMGASGSNVVMTTNPVTVGPAASISLAAPAITPRHNTPTIFILATMSGSASAPVAGALVIVGPAGTFPFGPGFSTGTDGQNRWGGTVFALDTSPGNTPRVYSARAVVQGGPTLTATAAQLGILVAEIGGTPA